MLLTSSLNFTLIETVCSILQNTYFRKIFRKIRRCQALAKKLRRQQEWLKRPKQTTQTEKPIQQETATQPVELAKLPVVERPDHIDANHWEELTVGSAIAPELVSLNIKSISGDAVYEYLCYGLPKDQRTNTGRLNSYWLTRYKSLTHGVWVGFTLDLQTGSNRDWVCVKPNQPRTDKDGKTVKYEHPAKVATECFFARVTPEIWEKIAAKAGVALPPDYQTVLINPLLFWQWVIANNVTIIFTEGLKKALAALTAGYVAIGFPGVTSIVKQKKNEFGDKEGKPYLIPQLKPFLGTKREIILAFDADSKRSSVKNVNRALELIGKTLQYNSCSVKVATWHNSLGKGLDDVLVNFGEDSVDDIYRNVLTFPQWQTKQLRQLTYIPDVLINQKYLMNKDDKGILTAAFKLSSDWQLLWLKAHKGAGKTTFINSIIAPLISSGERRVLLLTHRISLGKNSCDDLGLQYIDEKSEESHGRHLGLCIDSLLKLNPEHWKGAYLILDEIQQLKWHVLNSKTCRKKRVAILKRFRELINIIINSGGKIIIADADLRDDGIDFIVQQLEQEIKIFGVLNTYVRDENDRWTIYNYTDKNPARLISKLIDKLEAGEKILLCTSGQKAKSTWGSQVMERHVKKLLPDCKILRIDSISVGDKEHPAYKAISHFREAIEGYQLVIASPTIETGVNLDFDYFNYVFGIFQGVQTCDSVRQHTSRYRKPVDRHLWISPTGINSNRIGNGANTIKGLLSGEYQKDKINVHNLMAMGFEESLEGSHENIYLNHWAIDGAIINDGFINYRKQTLEGFKAEGHVIINCSCPEKENYPTRPVVETREETYQEHRENVEKAEDIDAVKFEELDKKPNLTQSQRYELEKARLANYYNVPVTQNLVQKNDDGWGTEIKYQYLLENPDSLAHQEKEYYRKAIENGGGHRAIWDDNKKAMSAKINALKNLKLPEVLVTNGLHENHPLAIEIGDKARANLNFLKLILKDFRDPKKPKPSNMFILRKLVEVIGYKLPQIKNQVIDGKRVWVHGIPAPDFEYDIKTDNKGKQKSKLRLDSKGQPIPIPDGREEVFAAWKAREQPERIEEQLTKQLQSEMNASNYGAIAQTVEAVRNVNLESHPEYEKAKDAVETFVNDNQQTIRNLQSTHEVKWHQGQYQVVDPSVPLTSNTPSSQQEVKQMQLTVNSQKVLKRNVEAEKAEFNTYASQVKNLIMQNSLQEAMQMIENWGLSMKLEIEKWFTANSELLGISSKFSEVFNL
jgi:hypothetical protein